MLLRCASALVAFALTVGPACAALPRPAHTIVVIEENHTYAQVVASGKAPYLARLQTQGALFTRAFGVTHPSLPNYFALFAGLTNTNGDDCPAVGIPSDAPNIASELLAAHLTFDAYSEGLPSVGWKGCAAGSYGRKHAPWVQFANVPGSLERPLDDMPAYDKLGTVTYVVPDLDDDMHDGTVEQGDAWFAKHFDGLVRWAASHDSLIVITWDEGYDSANSIPTFFVGPMVKPGRYAERIDHYRVLRTLEQMYGLAPTGRAARVQPIADIWR